MHHISDDENFLVDCDDSNVNEMGIGMGNLSIEQLVKLILYVLR